jgi:hypothetical protein
MSDRKPGSLRNLKIKRVALVDMGANFDKKTGDGAHILLHKSADSDAGHPAAARDRIEPPTGPATGRLATLNAFVAALNKENPVKKTLIAKLFGLAAEPDAVKRAEAAADVLKEFPDEGEGKPVHKADDPMCKCADCVAKTSKAFTAEDIAKAVKTATDEAVSKAVEDVNKRLAEEIKKREEGELREVLKSFKATPFDLDKDVPIYLALKKADPASFDRTIAIMKATDAQLAQSNLYKDFGSRSGAGEGSAWAQIEAKADQLIEKSTTPLTRAAAIEKVMEANPKLVHQYRQEQQ